MYDTPKEDTGRTGLYNEQEALTPDPGTEADSLVDNNPFAYSRGQLEKIFNPKKLGNFQALGGLQGIASGLQAHQITSRSVDEQPLDGPVRFNEASTQTKPDERVYEIHGYLGNESARHISAPRPVAALGDTGGQVKLHHRVVRQSMLFSH